VREFSQRAFVGISEDKKHDSYSMRHFSKMEWDWLIKEDFFERENIVCVYTHSDNAAQHFKSGNTLNWYSNVVLGGRKLVFIWGFGAPGHGKGEWDGMFGWLKSYVRRTIIAAVTNSDVIKTTSTKIKNAWDVFEQLVANYDTDEWRALQAKKSKRHVQRITFVWAGSDDIVRPRLPEHFEVQKGVRSTYEWRVLGLGCYASRRLACNCISCLTAKCGGVIVPSAIMQAPSPTPSCEHAYAPDFYGWTRSSCKKLGAVIVAKTRAESQAAARKQAPKLNSGEWVFFQARDCRDDDWWLARTIAVNGEGFDDTCFQKMHERTTLDFVQFDKDDYAIAVQWYERNVSDPARLEFSMIDSDVCLVNSTELRHWLPRGDIEQTGGPLAVVARQTRGGSRATPPVRALHAAAADAKKEFKRTYRVRSDVEQVVLDRCW
jgi:hypothetical protein